MTRDEGCDRTDMLERLPTHERLPTKEQINAIDSLDALSDIQDSVMEAIKAIEVDLEYRSDDDADDEWEHRARKALTAHYIVNTRITQRVSVLRRGKMVATDPVATKKIAKREAAAKLLAAQAEHKLRVQHQEREKTVRTLIAQIDRHSFLSCFYSIARQELGSKEFGRLVALAKAETQERIEALLPEIEGERVG